MEFGKMDEKYKEILIVVVGTIIAAAVTFGWTHVTRPEAVVVTAPAGWQTYTNTDYGFGFAYPENWSKLEYPSPSLMVLVYNPSETAQAYATVTTADLDLENYVASEVLYYQTRYPDFTVENEENITVNGIAGLRVTWRYRYLENYSIESENIKETLVYSLTRGWVFIIGCSAYESSYSTYEENFNKIIDSLVVR
jgi:hypothetical protein